ncbi:MAG: leucyl aminopeptidase family protein [Hyphomicrobiaceae bacterium]|nr:MAG: leucyl aminopeptidase family protein [Hyphomicrobiaceae bacterium]
MTARDKKPGQRQPQDLLLPPGEKGSQRPIWLVRKDQASEDMAALPEAHRAWLSATGFKAQPGKAALLPGADGNVDGAVLVIGNEGSPESAVPLAAGVLPALLPEGRYRFATAPKDATLVGVAFAMGAYRFERYKGGAGLESRAQAELVLPEGADRAEAVRIAEGVWLGRDLINTPASDLGPAELASAAVALAKRHGARASVTEGEDLLKSNLPLVHAVGRASPRAPRLVDIRWEPKGVSKNAPRIAVIGKGICFDTGGLDIKPASSMLLMKKDMGGAASTLALAHMVMSAGLDLRLRVIVAAAENSIAGNAMRPSDIVKSRAGLTVEIGNTDAEGRLVLADAMALADEEKPDLMVSLATLTGAARVALGSELPPLYATDDSVAADTQRIGLAIGDPSWRLPFWPNYDRLLDSDLADLNNVSEGGMAGSVVAANFLRRFQRQTKSYMHLDIYGWVPSARPGQPKGGEVQMARALYGLLRQRYAP